MNQKPICDALLDFNLPKELIEIINSYIPPPTLLVKRGRCAVLGCNRPHSFKNQNYFYNCNCHNWITFVNFQCNVTMNSMMAYGTEKKAATLLYMCLFCWQFG